MATFNKDLTVSSSQGWIHELARAEVHPEAEAALKLMGKGNDPEQLIEEQTIVFLEALKQHFTDFARIFNSFSEAGSKYQEIKIYSVAQSAADFMIFRNYLKLLFTNTAHGVIQIDYSQHMRPNFSVDGIVQQAPKETGQSQTINAQLGPLREVNWLYQGERVNAESVAKFYFMEFVRSSHAKRSKVVNQLLLEQIKALLEEKGLDF